MKEFKSVRAPKYDGGGYSPVEEGICKTVEDGEPVYVTTLSFIQEPELGEGPHAGEIAQYPLEDLLDAFFCYVSDFYEEQNTESSQVCVLEFAAEELENLRRLRTVIGKHVYNREVDGRVELVIQ